MLNVVTDKVAHCRKHGIDITEKEWDCKEMPGTLVTDKGSEYASENFEQLTDMGVSIINLPSYRPELKGSVEKFFDLIQSTYKPYLKGKGVYLELVLAGKLNEHLHQIDEECHQMMDRLVEQMKEQQGVTEELKMQDQMA